MASELVVSFEDQISSFSFKKLERSDIYGHRSRIPLDDNHGKAQRVELTEDGLTFLSPGMTGQGYYDMAGRRISQHRMKGVYPDGRVAARCASTLNEAQGLIEVAPQDLLDHRIEAVYRLEPSVLGEALSAALDAGAIYQFPFSYRGGYRLEVAFLLRNEAGLYALVGQPTTPRWCTLAEIPAGGAEPFGDDLDFEVL